MTTPFEARFELGELLGSGSTATVHRARDRNTGRDVAVKFLAPSGTSGIPQVHARFLREIALLATVRSPWVVQVIDAGEAGGRPYLVMEFIDAVDLARWLKDRGPFAPAEARLLGSRLVDGLEAIHEVGVVHRDLKPGNVLLDEEGHPRIADFGLARGEGESGIQTKTGLVVGTPGYIAPEVLLGKKAAPPADVYALGVILYQVHTGRLPFAAADPGDLMMEQLQGVPGERFRGLPPEVAPLIEAMLATDPGDRPDLAAARAALERAHLEDRSFSATVQLPSSRATAPPPAGPAPVPRRSGPALLAATALLAAGWLLRAALVPAPAPGPPPAPPPGAAEEPLEDLVRALGRFSFRRELTRFVGGDPAEQIHVALRVAHTRDREGLAARLREHVRKRPWFDAYQRVRDRVTPGWWARADDAPDPDAAIRLRRSLARRLAELARLDLFYRYIEGPGEVIPGFGAMLAPIVRLTPRPEHHARADQVPGTLPLFQGCQFLSSDSEAASVGRLVAGFTDPPACEGRAFSDYRSELRLPLAAAAPAAGEPLRLGFSYFSPERANFLDVAFLDLTGNVLLEVPVGFPGLARRFRTSETTGEIRLGPPLLVELETGGELLQGRAHSVAFRLRNLAATLDPKHSASVFLAGAVVLPRR